VPSHGEIRASGPALSDKGVHEGRRILVSEYQVPLPSQGDRIALGRYAGLMYERAPKNETAIMGFGAKYDLAAQQELDRLMPGMRTGLATELARRRTRMLAQVTDIGGRLAEANWWVIRAGKGEAFVLGDSPVAATDSLGHDDDWRAIFSPGSYAVVMPLGPTFALIMAPQRILPITGIDVDLAGMTRAINRLMWRYADRYVLAHDRTQLEASSSSSEIRRGLAGSGRRSSIGTSSTMTKGSEVGVVMRVGLSRCCETSEHLFDARHAVGRSERRPRQTTVDERQVGRVALSRSPPRIGQVRTILPSCWLR